MAKKDAYYFSHDANAQDDPKCMTLIDQLGMEGYGIFWGLIEKLRNEAEYKLPITIASSLAKRWGTSKEKVEAVINGYSLFEVVDGYFKSVRLVRSMTEKSKKARESANYRWQNANALQSHSDRNATGMRIDAMKEKEIESKEKEEETIQQIFEMMKRATTGFPDDVLISESGKLVNKYPDIVPNKAASLVNTWAGNIKKVLPASNYNSFL